MLMHPIPTSEYLWCIRLLPEQFQPCQNRWTEYDFTSRLSKDISAMFITMISSFQVGRHAFSPCLRLSRANVRSANRIWCRSLQQELGDRPSLDDMEGLYLGTCSCISNRVLVGKASPNGFDKPLAHVTGKFSQLSGFQ
jgi:hypothetical protein